MHTTPRIDDIVLAIERDLERPQHNALALVDNGVGVLLHDWELGVDISESRVAELVRLAHVRLGV